MATTIQGNGGLCALPTGFNASIDFWTATLNVETVDTTEFNTSAGFGELKPTLVSMSGTATGNGEYDAASTAPATTTYFASPFVPSNWKGTITLTASQAAPALGGKLCTYAFTAVITSISLSRPHDGKFTVTFSFESSGAITQTW